MKKMIFVSTCLLIVSTVHAQTRIIDSLKHLLTSTIHDTTRVMALRTLAFYMPSVDALKLDSQALSLARKIKYANGEAASLNQFGNDFLGTGNLPRALDYYLQSMKINEKISNLDGLASNYGNIANIYSAQEDYNAALASLYKSIKLRQQTGNDKIRNTYMLMGSVYEKMDQLDSSMLYYQKSLEIFNRISDKYQLSAVLYGLGKVNAKLGHTELAFAYYRMGIVADAPFPDSIGYFGNSYGLAALFKQTGQTDSSIYYAKRALSGTKRSDIIIKSGLLLSELYEGKDDRQSFYYYKLAISTRDSVLSAEKQTQIKNMNFNEQERQREITSAELKAKKERVHNIQYAAITLGVISFLILFFALSHSIVVNERWVRFFGILTLSLLFLAR
jgi:tetratricopeptide (TPR) repeat protein